jgi:hypothetical protein
MVTAAGLMMMRIAFVTHRALQNLAADDRLAAAALASRGAVVTAAVWDDPNIRWDSFDAVVIRSCWDYYLRMAEFERWLDQLDTWGAAVWNPTATLRWNLDKRYLRELEEQGIAIVPTRWCEDPHGPALADIIREMGWEPAVVKPAISAGAHETRIITAAGAARDEAWFRRLLGSGAAMIQPYLAQIENDGEWSLCFVAGKFSHAVRKTPRRGDFRVQHQHGGSLVAAEPATALLRAAESVVARAPGPLLYARVDGVLSDGSFQLMELEVLEPSLFLDAHADAPGAFAQAILGTVLAGAGGSRAGER